MGKLDNYIYYTICEKTYEQFKKSHYMTYSSFCNGLKYAIESNDFSKKEYSLIFEINIYLNLIYGIDKQTSSEYISKFFIEEKNLIFEIPVRMVIEYFKNSLG